MNPPKPRRRRVVASLGLLASGAWPLARTAFAAAPSSIEVGGFSREPADGGTPVGWEVFRPAPKAPSTRYTRVADGGTTVIRAEADKSMSGLLKRIDIDVQKTPLLRWRWKIDHPVENADLTKKSGDDYAARIYVLFDLDPATLSFATRLQLKLAKTIYGIDVPAASLNYVWDNRHPIGLMRASAFTDRLRLVVVESGTAKAGSWVTETRDVEADFRRAFGDEAPPRVPNVIGLAIATDTDNTGGQATAWYGDIAFLSRDG